jgi:short-subunit dehydrogenase
VGTVRRIEDRAALEEAGVKPVMMEMGDPDSVQDGFREAMEHTGGRLFGVVLNAGYGQPGALEDLSRMALREQFETNVFGLLELQNMAIAVMRRQGGGRIIINGSVLGVCAAPYRGAYSATKYALEAVADTLRLELRGSGIMVSLLEPGPIKTRFRSNALRAFQRHVDVQSSAHRAEYERLLPKLAAEESSGRPMSRFTLGPEAVVRDIVHALESARPRVRYRITFPARLAPWLRSFLPTAWLDRIMLKQA